MHHKPALHFNMTSIPLSHQMACFESESVVSIKKWKKKTREKTTKKKIKLRIWKTTFFFISTYKCTLFKFPVNLYSIYVIIQYYLIASICQHPLTWIHQTVSTILLSILLFRAGLQETYLSYIVKTDTKLFIHAHQHLYYQ